MADEEEDESSSRVGETDDVIDRRKDDVDAIRSFDCVGGDRTSACPGPVGELMVARRVLFGDVRDAIVFAFSSMRSPNMSMIAELRRLDST